jgi:hypothetical protein
MNVIHGTYLDGKIVPDSIPQWGNGTRVVMELENQADQGNDPDSIARWIAWYDALEPLILTADDEERMALARKEQREFELANWESRSRMLENLFQ